MTTNETFPLILAFDEDPLTQGLTRRILSTLGCMVFATGSESDFLELLDAKSQDLRAILLDDSSCEKKVEWFLSEIRSRNTDVAVHLMTADEVDGTHFESLGVAGVLHKPLRIMELKTLVQRSDISVA